MPPEPKPPQPKPPRKGPAWLDKVPYETVTFLVLLGSLGLYAYWGVQKWGVVQGWTMAVATFAVVLLFMLWITLGFVQRTMFLLLSLHAKHTEAFVRFANGRGDRDPKDWAKDRRQR